MKYATVLLVAGSALSISAPAMAQSAVDGTFTGPRVEIHRRLRQQHRWQLDRRRFERRQ
jgi:hypothetical protein